MKRAEARSPAPQSRLLLSVLDRRDTAILKALAISAIVLHNFFHAVSPAHQNEFRFHPAAFQVFLETVRHAPLAIQAVFSFFGHFGVQIFVFLSAYGLAKSHWDSTESWPSFMAARARKLFPVFALVVVPWALAVSIALGPMAFLRQEGAEVALMFVGLAPFLPGHGLPPVGPWWFIAFILQFYALWLPLRWVTKRFGWQGLVALSLLCMGVTAALNPVLAPWVINLFETPIGRMPVLCIGIAAARYPFRISAPMALVGMALLLLGSQYVQLFPFTFIGALLACLWLYLRMRDRLRRFSTLERMGEWSVLVFLLNALVRDELLPYATTPARELAFGALTLIMSFVVAAVLHMLLFADSTAANSARASNSSEIYEEEPESGAVTLAR